MRFEFWYRWLLLVSIVFTIAGLVIALFPDTLLFDPHRSATEQLFFNGRMSDQAGEMRVFLHGPLGGTIAGYFLMQTIIVWRPFHRREEWAWHAVLWPVLLWFIIDSGVSIYHGAWFNVWMVNIWTLLLVGLPLAMTRRQFRKNR